MGICSNNKSINRRNEVKKDLSKDSIKDENKKNEDDIKLYEIKESDNTVENEEKERKSIKKFKSEELNEEQKKLLAGMEEKQKLISKEENFFSFIFPQSQKPNYIYFTNFFSLSSNDFSTIEDYTRIISSNQFNPLILCESLLRLKERKWYKESISISDNIKKYQGNLSELYLNQYIHTIILQHNHFNWLVYSLSFYYCKYFMDKQHNKFRNQLMEEISLPSTDSIDWFKGFEWNGLYIKVQSFEDSKDLFNEIKALNYLFFDYIQILEYYRGNSFNRTQSSLPLLSNELIFPLISYCVFNGLVLYATPVIWKLSYDIELESRGFNELSNSIGNTLNALNNKKANSRYFDTELNETNKFVNNDLNLERYSKENLESSIMLKGISQKNLMKVIDKDELNSNTNYQYKFLIINARDLIPNLFEIDRGNLYSEIEKLNICVINNNIKRFYTFYPKIEQLENKNILRQILEEHLNMEYNNKIESEIKTCRGVEYKVIYLKGEINPHDKHSFADYLLNNDYFQNENLSKQNYLKKTIIDNNFPVIIQYRLSKELKIKYSLIRSINSKNSNEIQTTPFHLRSSFLIHFEEWCKSTQQTNLNIHSISGLKDYMHRYGLNSSLSFFSLPYFKVGYSSYIGDLIKMKILVGIIQAFFDQNEYSNLYNKIYSYEKVNKNESIIESCEYDFMTQNNSLSGIRKEKIFYLIQSILYPYEIKRVHGEKYLEFVYDEMLFYLNLKFLKWRLIDKYFGMDFFKTNANLKKTPNVFLEELLQIAREKPFLFLSSLEYKLNFTITPLIKFKASFSLESFYNQLNTDHITLDMPKCFSYINLKEISGYLLVKEILIDDNIKDTQSIHSGKNSNAADISIRKGIKPNSIKTKPSNFSVNSKLNGVDNKNNVNDTLHTGRVLNTPHKITWKMISKEFAINLPPLLYKLKYQSNADYRDNIYQFLSNVYFIKKSEYIFNWSNKVESIFSNIISIDMSIETELLKCLLFIFIDYFYIEKNIEKSKEIIGKIRELYSKKRKHPMIFHNMIIIHLLTALIDGNYINSEQYYSKCLILSLLTYGDPRGRFNDSHQFLLYPIWVLARKTFNLEPLNCESFIEMFNCLEYYSKIPSNLQFSFINLGYSANQRKNKKYLMLFAKTKINPSLSRINIKSDSFDFIKEGIDERSSFIINNDNTQNDTIDSNNFFNDYSETPNKSFKFPDIEEKNKNIDYDFLNKDFVVFILKLMVSILNDNGKEIPITNDIQEYFLTDNDISKNNKYKSKSKREMFSKFLYDDLLIKMSFLNHCPNGILIAFGNNAHCETGNDKSQAIPFPRMVYKLKNLNICKISSGWEHNVVIDSKGDVITWGRNQSLQCGIDNKIKDNTIVSIPQNITKDSNIKAVKCRCGNEYSLIITTKGEVYGCGSNDDGVLGLEDITMNTKDLVKIQIPCKNNIISLSCGTVHNIALTEEGKIYSWGSAQGGQLGIGKEQIMTLQHLHMSTPILLSEITSKVVKISCGEAHSVALCENGICYSWGFGSNGQLGLGFCEDSYEPGTGMLKSTIYNPTIISKAPLKVKHIHCGKTFSTFITEEYELYSCGVNDLYQIGIENSPPKSHLYLEDMPCYDFVIPTRIEHFLKMKVKKVACGEGHCIALVNDSMSQLTLWGWGNNKFGQLGIGIHFKTSLPRPINYFMRERNWIIDKICCGGFHSLCLLKMQNNVDFERDDEITRILIHNSGN